MAYVLPFPSCFIFGLVHVSQVTLQSPNSEETNVGLHKDFATWDTLHP